MKHQLLKPSQRLQLDGLDPNIQSTILANKTEQMPQQYQMNVKSKSNSASMNENSKTEMKTKQPFGKKRSGLRAKNGNYVEIEEKSNRFELFGLRPIKRQMPPPSKPKKNQKLMATKSIGEATLKRNWTDNNILAGRRWSMKNPLEHLLKEQQKQQKKTSTKMAKPKPNKKENVEEKQQNEENSGELTNEEEEGIIEKGQPAEPIIKKRGRPKGSGVKRNYFTWEPVTEEEEPEPVVKKTRTRGAKKNEEKVVEEKLVAAEQQLEPNEQQIEQDATIRLCDIGNAVFAGRPQKDKCVSTSHYRAPEAILETGFGHPCDVWSLGCIIFELYAGHFLIPKVSNLTHLQMLERILGTTNELPQWMREQTKKPGLFDSRLKLLNRKQPQEERDSNCKIEDAKPLKSYIYAGHEDDPDHKALFDLIAQMLNHDPNMRVKLATSQSHEFFNSLEPALRAKVDRGGWDEDKKQSRKQRNKIYPSKVKQNGQQQSGIIAENFDADGNGGGAGPSHK